MSGCTVVIKYYFTPITSFFYFQPPIIPKLAFESDTSNFEDFDETFDLTSTPTASIVVQNKFSDWYFKEC